MLGKNNDEFRTILNTFIQQMQQEEANKQEEANNNLRKEVDLAIFRINLKAEISASISRIRSQIKKIEKALQDVDHPIDSKYITDIASLLTEKDQRPEVREAFDAIHRYINSSLNYADITKLIKTDSKSPEERLIQEEAKRDFIRKVVLYALSSAVKILLKMKDQIEEKQIPVTETDLER